MKYKFHLKKFRGTTDQDGLSMVLAEGSDVQLQPGVEPMIKILVQRFGENHAVSEADVVSVLRRRQAEFTRTGMGPYYFGYNMAAMKLAGLVETENA
jgi:hypothetical protein